MKHRLLRSVLIVFILLITFRSYSQNLDSLWSVRNNTSLQDTTRTAALLQIVLAEYMYSDSGEVLLNTALEEALVSANRNQMSTTYSIKANYMMTRGRFDEAVEILNKQLEVTEPKSKSAAGAWINLGYCSSQTGNYEDAIHFFEKGIAVCREIGEEEFQSNGLNNLSNVYLKQGDFDKTIDLLEEVKRLASSAENYRGLAAASINEGKAYELKGNVSKAIEEYDKALKIQTQRGIIEGKARTLSSLGTAYLEQDEFELASRYLQMSYDTAQFYQDIRETGVALNNLGFLESSMGNREKAIENYNRGLEIHREVGNATGAITALNNMGTYLQEDGKIDTALSVFEECLEINRIIGSRAGEAGALINIGGTYAIAKDYPKAIENLSAGLNIAKEIGSINDIWHAAKDLSKVYALTRDYEKALEMKDLYVTMRDSVRNDENQRALLRREYKFDYEMQALSDSIEFAQKEAIQILELEKKDESIAKQRWALAGTGVAALLLGLLFYFVRKGKRRSDELLLNILPEEVMKEVKEKGYADAKHFDNATIFFSDFVGFTGVSEKLSPAELVKEIDTCFKAFDHIVQKHNIEKIKTIGDAYMAAGGLPQPKTGSAVDVIFAALEMIEFIEKRKLEKDAKGEPGFEMRVGIHTGQVVAGIVGVKKFQYDVWGDTVNTASRLESSGESGKVNISEVTYTLVKDHPDLVFESRGEIQAKGKGMLKMFFVSRKMSAD